jgi:hypothetical protein
VLRLALYIKNTYLVVTFAVYMTGVGYVDDMCHSFFSLFFLAVAHANYKVAKRNHEGYGICNNTLYVL